MVESVYPTLKIEPPQAEYWSKKVYKNKPVDLSVFGHIERFSLLS